MKNPAIKIRRVYMYCHEVTYNDGGGEIRGIIEDSPTVHDGVLIWENEFKASPERRRRLIEAIKNELIKNGKKPIVHMNADRC